MKSLRLALIMLAGYSLGIAMSMYWMGYLFESGIAMGMTVFLMTIDTIIEKAEP